MIVGPIFILARIHRGNKKKILVTTVIKCTFFEDLKL